MRCFLAVLVLWLGAGAVRASDATPFSQSLTPEQKAQLGLAGLSAAQWAALDAVVGAYARGETAAAVQRVARQSEEKVREVRQEAEVKVQAARQQAEVEVREARRQAADSAVAEYRKKDEPSVVARTLEVFKRRQAEEAKERFTARVVGPFRGWSGGTYFPLENGQVWRQVGTESNELPVVPNAEVEIYRSGNGYWRLRYDGAWITVKRLQ